jgi:molybdopterin converting factor small subunit
MLIEVRFFASLVDSTGASRDRVELPAGSDVSALWDALIERYPALETTSFRPLVACDMEYATWDANLDDVHEVAFLAPLSGG